MVEKMVSRVAQTTGALILIAYIFAMFIHPFTQGNWDYVQSIWERWLSLNSAMIAFAAAAIIAIIQHRINNQRLKQDRLSARAFLPSQLSYIIEICDQNIVELGKLYEKMHQRDDNNPVPMETDDLPPLKCDLVKFGTYHHPYCREVMALDIR